MRVRGYAWGMRLFARLTSCLAATVVLTTAACTPTGGAPTTPATAKPATGGPAATGGASARPGTPSLSPGPTASAGPLGVRPSLAPGLVPRPVAQVGEATQLTGKVKLLSDNGGAIISNNTGGLIANNGGAVVANNGGGLVANNGGGVIANNGGAFRVLQAASKPGESLLADAVIEVYDAAGQILTDVQGRPLSATSDQQGNYRLSAVLPGENLIVRVRLSAKLPGAAAGGELSAIVPRDGGATREVAIDTAATLGAAYVLSQFVRSQPDPRATFDKLPGSEAARLRADLEAATGFIDRSPAYTSAAMVALTDMLRAKAPAVDKTLDAIKALLLGQANLGAGRKATDVPLTDPRAVIDDGQGGFYVVEGTMGRVRHVDAQGAISTFADQLQGQVRENFFGALDGARGPDGSLYLFSIGTATVRRVLPDGSVSDAVPSAWPDADHPIVAWALAMGPDGTLWIGEDMHDGQAPRVLARGADGELREPALAPTEWKNGRITGLTVAGDGATYALVDMPDGEKDLLYRLVPGGAWTRFFDDLRFAKLADLATAADGSLLVSEDDSARLSAISLDGKRRILSDATAGGKILRPTDLYGLPNGHVRVIDGSAIRVLDLAPDGTVTPLAGSDAGAAASGDALPINAPFGLAYDAAGLLHVVETAGHSVRTWDGKRLTTIVGGVRGKRGDGGPATAAELDTPTALAFLGDRLIVLDQGNSRLRAVGPDGLLTAFVGADGGTGKLAKGVSYAANAVKVESGSSLVPLPDGSLLWAALGAHELQKRAPDGTVSLVAGTGKAGSEGEGGPAADAQLDTPFGVALAPNGDAYVTETGGMRVRRIAGLAGEAPTLHAFAGLGGIGSLFAAGSEAPGAKAAELAFVLPGPVACDKAGNVYVGELGTLNLPLLSVVAKAFRALPAAGLPKIPARVRKITPGGDVSVVAGPGGKFFSDPGAGDALVMPTALTIDPAGRLVIVDAGANVIRFIPAGAY